MKYCHYCGGALEVRKKGLIWYCSHCQSHLYANPVPTVDVLLLDEQGRILLGRRTREPHIGKLNVPGGFIDTEETLEEAAVREVKEELGLSAAEYSSLIYAGSRVDYNTQEGKRRQILVFILVGKMPNRDFAQNDEVDEYVWAPPEQLKPRDLTTRAEYEHIMKALNVYKSL